MEMDKEQTPGQETENPTLEATPEMEEKVSELDEKRAEKTAGGEKAAGPDTESGIDPHIRTSLIVLLNDKGQFGFGNLEGMPEKVENKAIPGFLFTAALQAFAIDEIVPMVNTIINQRFMMMAATGAKAAPAPPTVVNNVVGANKIPIEAGDKPAPGAVCDPDSLVPPEGGFRSNEPL